jgi:hypothetical protein
MQPHVSDPSLASQQPLEIVAPDAYASLPMFLRSQLPLDQMNSAIQGIVQLLQQQV